MSTLELLEQVQASEDELFKALNDMSAINLKSKWKVLKENDKIIYEISKAAEDER